MKRIALAVIALVLILNLFCTQGCIQPKAPYKPPPPHLTNFYIRDGAPGLNQERELVFLLKPFFPTDNSTATITLPDGLQLVSGNLTKGFGSIPKGGIRDLTVVFKPVQSNKEYMIYAKFTYCNPQVIQEFSNSYEAWAIQLYVSDNQSISHYNSYPYTI